MYIGSVVQFAGASGVVVAVAQADCPGWVKLELPDGTVEWVADLGSATA